MEPADHASQIYSSNWPHKKSSGQISNYFLLHLSCRPKIMVSNSSSPEPKQVPRPHAMCSVNWALEMRGIIQKWASFWCSQLVQKANTKPTKEITRVKMIRCPNPTYHIRPPNQMPMQVTTIWVPWERKNWRLGCRRMTRLLPFWNTKRKTNIIQI